jgi:hypothetical protein
MVKGLRERNRSANPLALLSAELAGIFAAAALVEEVEHRLLAG